MVKKLLGILLVSSMTYAFADTYFDADVGLNTSNANAAFNGDFGYMFNRYVGFEIGATLGNNYFMYDTAVKGVLPLGSLVDLYGKLGFGTNNYYGSYPNSTMGVLYGAGVALNLAKSWQIHLEDYTLTGDSPNFLMVGAHFAF